jgi:hypothetical protein
MKRKLIIFVVLVTGLNVSSYSQFNAGQTLENITITSGCSDCLPEVTFYSGGDSYWDIQNYIFQLNQQYTNPSGPNLGGCDNAGGHWDPCGNCIPQGGNDCTPPPDPDPCASACDAQYTVESISDNSATPAEIYAPVSTLTPTQEIVFPFPWDVAKSMLPGLWTLKANSIAKYFNNSYYTTNSQLIDQYNITSIKTISTSIDNNAVIVTMAFAWADDPAYHTIIDNNTASAKAKTQVVGQMNFNMIIPAPNCPTCTGISSKSIDNHCFFYPK